MSCLYLPRQSRVVNRQIRRFLRNFRIPIAIKDDQLCYQYANPAYARLLGVPKVESLRGCTDLDLNVELFEETLRKHFHQRDAEVLSNLAP